MQFNIIGAGRLGKNIALALVTKQLGELVGIYNHNFPNAKIAAQQIGSGTPIAHLDELPPVTLTFITTPDDTIHTLAKELAETRRLPKNSIVIHCSGALSSQELSPLKQQDCFVASIHPAKAFRYGHLESNSFENCICAIEGDREAIDLLTHLFTSLGALLVPIKAEKKINYHAASVFSANYLVTLVAASIELFIEAGISREVAQQLSVQLAHSSLNNLRETPTITQALTGPLARGDIQTISQHLSTLQSPHLNALYRAAAIATLPFVDLEDQKKQQLQQLLINNTDNHSQNI